jgi:hypothetical protein
MGVSGLSPLEFADCLVDGPDFRENLNKHEKELEKTSLQIKRIIKEIKDLIYAAKSKIQSWKCKVIIVVSIRTSIQRCIFLSTILYFDLRFKLSAESSIM